MRNPLRNNNQIDSSCFVPHLLYSCCYRVNDFVQGMNASSMMQAMASSPKFFSKTDGI
jgi:hypothetical protein